MASKSVHADDIAMKGGGYYSLATRDTKDVIDTATPLVLTAIERLAPGNDVGVFTMTDMGCADGGASIGMVRAALERVRALAPTRPIQIVYTDQIRNDYNALFQITHGATETESFLPVIEERQEIMDDYYNGYEATVYDNPEVHGMDYVDAYMSVIKS